MPAVWGVVVSWEISLLRLGPHVASVLVPILCEGGGPAEEALPLVWWSYLSLEVPAAPTTCSPLSGCALPVGLWFLLLIIIFVR